MNHKAGANAAEWQQYCNRECLLLHDGTLQFAEVYKGF
jgi:hypothetical protein